MSGIGRTLIDKSYADGRKDCAKAVRQAWEDAHKLVHPSHPSLKRCEYNACTFRSVWERFR